MSYRRVKIGPGARGKAVFCSFPIPGRRYGYGLSKRKMMNPRFGWTLPSSSPSLTQQSMRRLAEYDRRAVAVVGHHGCAGQARA